jgi:hypothetical protein
MVLAVTSAQRKLSRGIEQVNTLCAETSTFENGNAYGLRTERKERSPEEVEYVCFAVERQAPSDDWPLLAGEAIHNLRGSLDHAVYVASGGAEGTQFPITTTEANFKKRGRPMIARTPSAIQELIEARQPYKAIPDDPRVDALARLQQFSNLDKHKTLAIVACAVHLPYVSHSAEGSFGKFTYAAVDRPLHEGTRVMTYIAPVSAGGEQVDVIPNFVYQVRIEGPPLASTLTWIARRCFECVTECETAQPMPIVAQYPIKQRTTSSRGQDQGS